MQTAQDSILERINISRGVSEPEQSEPTENIEAVNVSEDTPIEEEVEPEALANEEITSEIEEPAEEVTEAEDHNEETDLFYYDIDGEEVSSDQLKDWKANGLMQADYTRKTQSHAEDVKAFKVKEGDFAVKESELNDKLLKVEAVLSKGTKTADEIAEMREYEPEEYIKYTEEQSELKEFVNSAKAATQQPSVDMVKVSADLAASHPEWMENGKQSKQFIVDTNLMTSYAESRGISQSDMTSFDARHYEIILDAARYKEQKNKNVAIEKKVRRAPVSTKPRGLSKGSDTAIDKAQKAFKNNPSVQNAAALRTAKRQLNS